MIEPVLRPATRLYRRRRAQRITLERPRDVVVYWGLTGLLWERDLLALGGRRRVNHAITTAIRTSGQQYPAKSPLTPTVSNQDNWLGTKYRHDRQRHNRTDTCKS